MALTRLLLGVAREHAENRCAGILEGGYDLHAIRSSTEEVLAELSGNDARVPPPARPSRADALVAQYKKVHGRYWRL